MIKIPYTVIGCWDGMHNGPMFIKHFDARDGKQALEIATWTALIAADVVGIVILGHATSLEPEIVAETPATFVSAAQLQLSWSKAQPTSDRREKHIQILEEYLTWLESVK